WTPSGAWSRTTIATTIPPSTCFISKPKMKLFFTWNRSSQRLLSSAITGNLLASRQNRILDGKPTPVFEVTTIEGVINREVQTLGNSSCKRVNNSLRRKNELNKGYRNSMIRFPQVCHSVNFDVRCASSI